MHSLSLLAACARLQASHVLYAFFPTHRIITRAMAAGVICPHKKRVCRYSHRSFTFDEYEQQYQGTPREAWPLWITFQLLSEYPDARVATDGNLWTYQDFLDYYTENGECMWTKAHRPNGIKVHRPPPGLPYCGNKPGYPPPGLSYCGNMASGPPYCDDMGDRRATERQPLRESRAEARAANTSEQPQEPFTNADAKELPQDELLDKGVVFRQLRGIPEGILVDWRWWLFVGNLGNRTEAVIGPGIIGACLAKKTKTSVHLLLYRINNTCVMVKLKADVLLSFSNVPSPYVDI